MSPEDERPKGAQEMNREFARRIKSFIEGKAWWDIAQQARAEIGDEHVWTMMVAGITDLGSSDLWFARSLNWSVSRKDLDFTNVETYEEGNWWYLADAWGEKTWGTDRLGIWGRVTISLKSPEDLAETKANARGFVAAMIVPAHLTDEGEIGEPKPKGAKQVEIQGVVLLR